MSNLLASTMHMLACVVKPPHSRGTCNFITRCNTIVRGWFKSGASSFFQWSGACRQRGSGNSFFFFFSLLSPRFASVCQKLKISYYFIFISNLIYIYIFINICFILNNVLIDYYFQFCPCHLVSLNFYIKYDYCFFYCYLFCFLSFFIVFFQFYPSSFDWLGFYYRDFFKFAFYRIILTSWKGSQV
jgi:hypothetical protein